MAGSATFTIVLSRPTISRLMQQIASTSKRRRRGNSGIRTSSRAGPASPAPATAGVTRDSHHRDLSATRAPGTTVGQIQLLEIHWCK